MLFSADFFFLLQVTEKMMINSNSLNRDLAGLSVEKKVKDDIVLKKVNYIIFI